MRRVRSSPILLSLLVGLFLVQAFRYAAHVNDDAYITFRYSLFLSLGRGPYFNPGEHVEGYTNFLLMLIESLVIAGLGPAAAAPFAKGLGVLAGVSAVVMVYLSARRMLRSQRLESPWPEAGGLTAAGLLSLSQAFALNSTSGLETTLFSSLVLLGVLLGQRESGSGRFHGSAVAFAAASLTRPEGVFFFGVHWLARLAMRRVAVDANPPPSRIAAPLRDAAIVGVVVAAQLVFRFLSYDGELLPNTYYAKLGGSGQLTFARYAEGGLLLPLLGAPGVVAGLLGLGLARARGVLVPVVAMALAGALLPLLTGLDWMPGFRLLMPALPLATVVVVAGWTLLWARLARGRDRLAVALLLALLPAWPTQEALRQLFDPIVAARARGLATSHRPLALWLRAHAKPGDWVALTDIGLIGFLNPDLGILDVTGLTDRRIAKSRGGFLSKEYDVGYVLGRKPRYVILVLSAPGRPFERPAPGTAFAPWSPIELRIGRDPEFQRLYVSRPADAAPASDDWMQELASRLGARRVFEHPLPGGARYFMTVYERRAEAAAGYR